MKNTPIDAISPMPAPTAIARERLDGARIFAVSSPASAHPNAGSAGLTPAPTSASTTNPATTACESSFSRNWAAGRLAPVGIPRTSVAVATRTPSGFHVAHLPVRRTLDGASGRAGTRRFRRAQLLRGQVLDGLVVR